MIRRTDPHPREIEALACRVDMDDLPGRLATGELAVFAIGGIDDGAVILSVGTAKDGPRCLWIAALAGTFPRRPKDNIQTMRAVLHDCLVLARNALCDEVRVEADTRSSWKLNLLPLFGFVPAMLRTGTVMRKAVDHG